MNPPRAGEPFTVLLDEACPLCRREGAMLRRLDRGRGRIRIVDIADPAFDPRAFGVTHEDVMGRLHGVTEDGSMVTGMEVFRRAYGAVGWGWVLAPTRWPGLRWVFDRLYAWFAANRLRITGRSCSSDSCADDRCAG